MQQLTFDADAWAERAAIMEFDGGMTRFAAETAAARLQGMERWQAIKEAENANGSGHSVGGTYSHATLAGKRGASSMPGVQRRPEEENGPLPERDPQAGRDCMELLALRASRRGVL